jgi:isopentenyl diphosphate isomerase/L-lactate dehydrogenase-like FMN-dependent dehydrogenase
MKQVFCDFRVSKLPLVMKGIQTPEDAIKAVKYGADAVFLSNHGGRQIDTAVPTVKNNLKKLSGYPKR